MHHHESTAEFIDTGDLPSLKGKAIRTTTTTTTASSGDNNDQGGATSPPSTDHTAHTATGSINKGNIAGQPILGILKTASFTRSPPPPQTPANAAQSSTTSFTDIPHEIKIFFDKTTNGCMPDTPQDIFNDFSLNDTAAPTAQVPETAEGDCSIGSSIDSLSPKQQQQQHKQLRGRSRTPRQQCQASMIDNVCHGIPGMGGTTSKTTGTNSTNQPNGATTPTANTNDDDSTGAQREGGGICDQPWQWSETIIQNICTPRNNEQQETFNKEQHGNNTTGIAHVMKMVSDACGFHNLSTSCDDQPQRNRSSSNNNNTSTYSKMENNDNDSTMAIEVEFINNNSNDGNDNCVITSPLSTTSSSIFIHNDNSKTMTTCVQLGDAGSISVMTVDDSSSRVINNNVKSNSESKNWTDVQKNAYLAKSLKLSSGGGGNCKVNLATTTKNKTFNQEPTNSISSKNWTDAQKNAYLSQLMKSGGTSAAASGGGEPSSADGKSMGNSNHGIMEMESEYDINTEERQQQQHEKMLKKMLARQQRRGKNDNDDTASDTSDWSESRKQLYSELLGQDSNHDEDERDIEKKLDRENEKMEQRSGKGAIEEILGPSEELEEDEKNGNVISSSDGSNLMMSMSDDGRRDFRSLSETSRKSKSRMIPILAPPPPPSGPPPSRFLARFRDDNNRPNQQSGLEKTLSTKDGDEEYDNGIAMADTNFFTNGESHDGNSSNESISLSSPITVKSEYNNDHEGGLDVKSTSLAVGNDGKKKFPGIVIRPQSDSSKDNGTTPNALAPNVRDGARQKGDRHSKVRRRSHSGRSRHSHSGSSVYSDKSRWDGTDITDADYVPDPEVAEFSEAEESEDGRLADHKSFNQILETFEAVGGQPSSEETARMKPAVIPSLATKKLVHRLSRKDASSVGVTLAAMKAASLGSETTSVQSECADDELDRAVHDSSGAGHFNRSADRNPFKENLSAIPPTNDLSSSGTRSVGGVSLATAQCFDGMSMISEGSANEKANSERLRAALLHKKSKLDLTSGVVSAQTAQLDTYLEKARSAQTSTAVADSKSVHSTSSISTLRAGAGRNRLIKTKDKKLTEGERGWVQSIRAQSASGKLPNKRWDPQHGWVSAPEASQSNIATQDHFVVSTVDECEDEDQEVVSPSGGTFPSEDIEGLYSQALDGNISADRKERVSHQTPKSNSGESLVEHDKPQRCVGENSHEAPRENLAENIAPASTAIAGYKNRKEDIPGLSNSANREGQSVSARAKAWVKLVEEKNKMAKTASIGSMPSSGSSQTTEMQTASPDYDKCVDISTASDLFQKSQTPVLPSRARPPTAPTTLANADEWKAFLERKLAGDIVATTASKARRDNSESGENQSPIAQDSPSRHSSSSASYSGGVFIESLTRALPSRQANMRVKNESLPKRELNTSTSAQESEEVDNRRALAASVSDDKNFPENDIMSTLEHAAEHEKNILGNDAGGNDGACVRNENNKIQNTETSPSQKPESFFSRFKCSLQLPKRGDMDLLPPAHIAFLRCRTNGADAVSGEQTKKKSKSIPTSLICGRPSTIDESDEENENDDLLTKSSRPVSPNDLDDMRKSSSMASLSDGSETSCVEEDGLQDETNGFGRPQKYATDHKMWDNRLKNPSKLRSVDSISSVSTCTKDSLAEFFETSSLKSGDATDRRERNVVKRFPASNRRGATEEQIAVRQKVDRMITTTSSHVDREFGIIGVTPSAEADAAAHVDALIAAMDSSIGSGEI